MKKWLRNTFLVAPLCVTGLVTACSGKLDINQKTLDDVPADNHNLSHWKVTLPIDSDRNGKADEIDVEALQTYSHPDFFYLDENGHMVFTVPNKGATTSSLASARSELRQMNRGFNTQIAVHAPANNVVIAANKNAQSFSSVGGKLNATLKVNAVSLRAGYPNKRPAYAVVVAQIHGGKIKDQPDGFGWANQPIKIYYKKFPHHEKGSIFWNYERNLGRNDPNKIDISYPVWGNTWLNSADPGTKGISLGEEFSYEINVHKNVMHLTFKSKGHRKIKYAIDLSNNVNAYGEVDELDHPQGYTGDWFYFRAGAYNQCSTKDAPSFVYTACPGTGDWAIDKENGDFTQVTFSKLELSDPTPAM